MQISRTKTYSKVKKGTEKDKIPNRVESIFSQVSLPEH